MRFAKHSIFTATLLCSVFGFIGTTSQAHACSCVQNGSPTEAFNSSMAVFSGTVTSIESDGAQNAITFDVDEKWKGDFSTPLRLLTSDSSASCGYEFNAGSDYLVYAYEDENQNLGVNLCSRTAMLVEAREDVEELNTITESVAPVRAFTSSLSDKNTARLWILLVGVLGYGAGFLVGNRGRNKKKK